LALISYLPPIDYKAPTAISPSPHYGLLSVTPQIRCLYDGILDGSLVAGAPDGSDIDVRELVAKAKFLHMNVSQHFGLRWESVCQARLYSILRVYSN
jgi:hypothetical protein